MMSELKNYKVWLHSKPGFYTYYDGYVTVKANTEEEAINRAFIKIKSTFPDRSRDMWVIEKTEVNYGE